MLPQAWELRYVRVGPKSFFKFQEVENDCLIRVYIYQNNHCFVKVNKGAMLSGEHAYMYVGNYIPICNVLSQIKIMIASYI